MSIKFLFGPAGSGKSTLVQGELVDKSLKAPKENFLYIVPDQFTMQSQMDIVKRHPNKGILNIDVLSFSRLSYRVFSVTGRAETPILDDTGKSLVLRRVAGEVAPKMPYIGKNLNKTGFIHEVKSSLSEFMQYGLSVKDVEKLSESLKPSLLKNKLEDLSVIYKAFMDFNKDKFITNEETLDLLCAKIPEADFIKGSTICFDGFTGFTPIQERVILKLCEYAKEVILTFDLSKPEGPAETGAEEKLFYLSRKSANRLKTFASDLNIEISEDLIIPDNSKGRFKNNMEFSHLEENLFRYPARAYTEAPLNIGVTACDNIDTEVSDIALKIFELIKSGDYAYRDFAVITGDLSSYGSVFERRFKELNIPCFIDRTNSIVLNPFIEYLKSALKILIKDFSYDCVFHYLRSGFTGFDTDEIDRFDRYVSSLNLRGKNTYFRPFKKREKGLKDVKRADADLIKHEEFRVKFAKSFEPLLRPNKTAGEYTHALYEFLTLNNSYEKLLEYEGFFEKENDLSRAKEYSQIYKCVMELLDTIDSLIGNEEMDLTEYYRIFEAGISEIKVGTIPKNVDRIVVGDIERTRLSEVKVLFFAGVNDGNIPKAADKGGLLSVSEREILESLNYDLAPAPREEMYTQRLYLYMNMCKPTDKLFISYRGTDTEGKGLRPSYLIDVLKKLYPKMQINKKDSTVTLNKLLSLSDSKRYFASLLRDYVSDSLNKEGKALTESLLRVYKDENTNGIAAIKDAAFIQYFARPISEDIIRLIYGNVLYASISRMELYAGCAYSHFLKYGMGLKKNAEFEFAAADLGSVYHGVLDCFSSELERNKLSWFDFDKETGSEMIKKAVKDYCENYEQGLLSDDEQSAYTVNKITRIMERTVDTLQFQLKKGKFKPESHEYNFEREIDLENNHKMHLNGKVDRIDLFETDDKIYVKIVDYKSGDKDIDITNVYHGVEQQLALYMAEAVYYEQKTNPGKEVVPSALLYYTISNPYIDIEGVESDEAITEKIRKELKFKGVFEKDTENLTAYDENLEGDSLVIPIKIKKDKNLDANSLKRAFTKEEMIGMLDYVEAMAKSIGERIYAGDIAINPIAAGKKDACKYCEYKTICRFDEKLPGFKKRDGKEITDEAAKEKVFGGAIDGVYSFS